MSNNRAVRKEHLQTSFAKSSFISLIKYLGELSTFDKNDFASNIDQGQEISTDIGKC